MTRILVVEDSPTQSARACLVLEEGGFEVESAVDGVDGQRKIEGSRFDLIVSDVVMPRLSGYELCRWVKSQERTRDTPVVLLTTLNDPMDIVQALEAGADNFISKPYEPGYLLSRIRAILESRHARADEKLSVNVEMLFMGRRLSIGSGKEQILGLLLSAFEDMVRTNRDLRATQEELSEAKEKLEGRVRTSEEMYGTLMAEASDSILLSGGDEVILEANRQTEVLLGRAAPEVVGRQLGDFLAPAPGSELEVIRHELEAGDRVRGADFVVERPDGSVVEAEASMSLVEVQGRRLSLALLRDVTEQRRAAAAASAQHEVTRILAECVALDEAAPRLVKALVATLGFELAVYWRIDHGSQTLRPLASWHHTAGDIDSGTSSRSAGVRSGEGLAGRAWATRQAVRTPDPGRGSRAGVAFPISSAAGLHGVVELSGPAVRPPDDRLAEKLTSFGSQIGQFLERQRAVQEMLESERRFRRLFESNTIGITMADFEGRILEANDAYLGMLGYSREELERGALRTDDLTPPEYRDFDRQTADQLRRTGVAPPREKELLRKDGARIPILIGVTMLEASEPRLLAYVVDLREQKRAEESARSLLHAVEQVGNIILMTDPSGAITYVNPAFEATYGFSREEVLGKTPRILKSGRHDEAFYRRLWGHLLSGKEFSAEIVNRTREGRLITVEWSARAVLDPGGKQSGFICVQNDVTAKRSMEEQLRLSQKMEAVGRLAGGVAHDFNNMLTAILGYADMLEASPGLAPAAREFVAEVQKAGQRAAGLTRQLLAFSRKQVLEPVVLGPNELISNLEGMLRRLIGEDLEFVTRLDRSVGNVLVDPGQLEQVIMNLAVNARDAMPRGGTLTIETAKAGSQDPEPRRWIVVSVTDTGVGMDADTMARVFEPFFTTKGPGKGTGLGLSTVHGIVHQSGGRLEVDSEPGHGTTFRVYLPQVDEDPVPAGQPSVVSKSLRGTETVLVVEDEGGIRKLVSDVLRAQGYTVLVAASGPEALQLAALEERPIHLLLTDLVMPGGMAGTELAKSLLESQGSLRVLFMSGYSNEAIENNGLVGKNNEFLGKPFTPNALLRKVREALGSP